MSTHGNGHRVEETVKGERESQLDGKRVQYLLAQIANTSLIHNLCTNVTSKIDIKF